MSNEYTPTEERSISKQSDQAQPIREETPKPPPTVEKVRLDKWLWAARIYKTRGEATEACKAGLVKLNNERVKPSHQVKPGEKLYLRKNELARIFQVVALLDRRVSAKIIDHFVMDLTPASEFEKLKNRKSLPGVYREKGMGRPTKRERRVLEKFQDQDQDTDQVQDL